MTYEFDNEKQRKAAKIILKRCSMEEPPNKQQLSNLVISKGNYKTPESATEFIHEFIKHPSTPIENKGGKIKRKDLEEVATWMGQQRHAWSDNETEEKIQKNLDQLKEEFGDNWKKEIWKIGVNEAIRQLPSLEERLQRVKDEKERIEEKEKKLMAKKRKENVKSQERKLKQEIKDLKEKIDEWENKKPLTHEEAVEEVLNDYRSRSGSWSDLSDEEIKDREGEAFEKRVQNKLEKAPSQEEKKSKISNLESKLEEKKEELEELEVQTYAPY